MNTHDLPTDEEVLGATSQPVTAGTASGPAPNGLLIDTGVHPTERVSKSYIFWMMAANFGISMAFIVPLSFSLAVRIDELAPGREEVLGYVTGSAQLI